MRPPTGQFILRKESPLEEDSSLGTPLETSLIRSSMVNGSIKLKNHPIIRKLNRKRRLSTIIGLFILTLLLDQKIPIEEMKNVYYKNFRIEKNEQDPNLISLLLTTGFMIGAPLSILSMKKMSPNILFALCCLTLSIFSLCLSLNYLDYDSFIYLYCPIAGVISGAQLVLPLYLIWRFSLASNKGFVCGLLMFIFKNIHYVVVKFFLVKNFFGSGLDEPSTLSNFKYKWDIFHLGNFGALLLLGVTSSFMVKSPITNSDLLKISPKAYQDMMQKSTLTIRETFRDQEYSSINYFWRNRLRVNFIENPPFKYMTESIKTAFCSPAFFDLLFYLVISSFCTPVLNNFCKVYLANHHMKGHNFDYYSVIEILSSFFLLISAIVTYKNGFFTIGFLIIFAHILISILSYFLIKFPQIEFLGLIITFLCKSVIYSFPPFIMIVCDKFFTNAGLLIFAFYLSIYISFQTLSLRLLHYVNCDGSYFMERKYFWILVCFVPFLGTPFLYRLHKKLCIYSMR